MFLQTVSTAIVTVCIREQFVSECAVLSTGLDFCWCWCWCWYWYLPTSWCWYFCGYLILEFLLVLAPVALLYSSSTRPYRYLDLSLYHSPTVVRILLLTPTHVVYLLIFVLLLLLIDSCAYGCNYLHLHLFLYFHVKYTWTLICHLHLYMCLFSASLDRGTGWYSFLLLHILPVLLRLSVYLYLYVRLYSSLPWYWCVCLHWYLTFRVVFTLAHWS